jgi:putative oxidoreductase
MNEQQLNQYGVFVLRVSLGVILIAHSLYLKLVIFTLPGTAQFFGSIGLPGFLAYVVFAIEALAGIAFILGFQTRLFAAITVPVLIGATWAHIGNGWLFTNPNGGWEYPMLLVFATIAQALLGDGAFALKLPTRQPGMKAVRA